MRSVVMLLCLFQLTNDIFMELKPLLGYPGNINHTLTYKLQKKIVYLITILAFKRDCLDELILLISGLIFVTHGITLSAASLSWSSWDNVKPTASITARLHLWFWGWCRKLRKYTIYGLSERAKRREIKWWITEQVPVSGYLNAVSQSRNYPLDQ